MDMKFIGIVASVIIIFTLIYFFVIAPSSNKSADEGKSCTTNDGKAGKIQGGVCITPRTVNPSHPTLNTTPVVVSPLLNVGSTSVNSSDVAQAIVNFAGMTEDDIATYNVLKSAGSNPKLIHYATAFANPCPQYVWYKNWLYSYRGTETDQNGNKTCYYGVDKSSLPVNLEVQQTGSACANFKLYLSGIEYKYSTTITQFGNKNICIYNKQ